MINASKNMKFDFIPNKDDLRPKAIEVAAPLIYPLIPQRQEEVSIYLKHLFFAVYTRYIPRIYLSWCLS